MPKHECIFLLAAVLGAPMSPTFAAAADIPQVQFHLTARPWKPLDVPETITPFSVLLFLSADLFLASASSVPAAKMG